MRHAPLLAVAACLLLPLLTACAPGSLLRPITSAHNQSLRRQHHAACAQALKYGWCVDGCRKQPVTCSRRLTRVPAAVGRTMR